MCEYSKVCKRCKEEKSLSEFGKCNRNKDKIQNFCKICRNNETISNKKNREPHEVVETGIKKCGKCLIEKDVIDFSINIWCSMGRHSHCKKCCVEKAKSHQLLNPRKPKPPKEKIPKIAIEKKLPSEKYCTHCSTTKLAEDFFKDSEFELASRCKSCFKIYTDSVSCSVVVSEKACGRCKIVYPACEFTSDANKRTGLSSSCSSCRKYKYSLRKDKMIAHNKKIYHEKTKHNPFERLRHSIRGRIRNSLTIYICHKDLKNAKRLRKF